MSAINCYIGREHQENDQIWWHLQHQLQCPPFTSLISFHLHFVNFDQILLCYFEKFFIHIWPFYIHITSKYTNINMQSSKDASALKHLPSLRNRRPEDIIWCKDICMNQNSHTINQSWQSVCIIIILWLWSYHYYVDEMQHPQDATEN